MGKVLLFSLAVVLMVVGTQAMSCAKTCSPCPATKMACEGGRVSDFCGCCDVCAKVVGEECGGPYDMMGRCDEGLRCDVADPSDFNAHGECVEIEEETPPSLLY